MRVKNTLLQLILNHRCLNLYYVEKTGYLEYFIDLPSLQLATRKYVLCIGMI